MRVGKHQARTSCPSEEHSGDLASKHPQRQRRQTRWVWLASTALAVFTTFVLLDTFAIGRVQQVAQAADYSSIVAAQEQSQTADATDSDAAGSTADAIAANSSGSDGSNGASADNVDASASTGQESNPSSAAAPSKPGSSQREGNMGPGGHRPGGKGGRHHGSSSGSADSSSASGSSSRPKPSSGARSSSANADAVAGAGSVSTAGTQIGTYSDDNMSITVSQVRAYDTDIYVADIQVSSAEYLKTALAQNAFGRNLKDTTSNMASAAGAVLAINGDYYGFRDDGYVVRNGVLYRDTASSGSDALVVYGNGTMASVSQDQVSAQQLVSDGAWQVLSFGPTLVQDGQLAVSQGDEVDQSMGSNPRTAIGMVDALHYIVVVSDGRTSESQGLSLYQLAQVLVDNGATYAYNLDGGGSTTLYFQGEIVNNPTSGNSSGERKVSDIVYFG